jgi:hypothetical protein
MHDIKLEIQWLFAVIAVVPSVLLVVFLVKDRLRQRRQGVLWRSMSVPRHGVPEHSVSPNVATTSYDERTEKDRSRQLRQIQELEALEQRLNRLRAELQHNGSVVR